MFERVISSFVSETGAMLLADIFARSTIVLLTAAGFVLLLRRASAATRHLVWQTAIVVTLTLPVSIILLPAWKILPQWSSIESVSAESGTRSLSPSKQPADASKVPAAPAIPLPPAQAANLVPVTTDQPELMSSDAIPSWAEPESGALSSQSSSPVSRILPGAWLAGFLFLLLRLIAARTVLFRKERRSETLAHWSHHTTKTATKTETTEEQRTPIKTGPPHTQLSEAVGVSGTSSEQIVECFYHACACLQIRQQTTLLVSDERMIPIVWGIRHVRLQLPSSARHWNTAQLRSVLLHELSHAKRRDPLWQLLTQLTVAVHWCNPVVWVATWRLHIERERAADDLVLNNGVRASTYAEHLLDIATSLTGPPWTYVCGLAMASRSSLEQRLHAVLSSNCNRRHVKPAASVSVMFLSLLVTLPLAILSPADEPERVTSDPSEVNSPALKQTPAVHGVNSVNGPEQDSPSHQHDKAPQITIPSLEEGCAISLDPAFLKYLNWGQESEGLRAALMIHSSATEPLELFVVLQNVSQQEIRICDTEGESRRTLYSRRKGKTLAAMTDSTPQFNQVVVKPRQVVLVPMFARKPVGNQQRSVGSILSQSALIDSDQTLSAKLKFSGGREAAWQGSLETADISGLAAAVSIQTGHLKRGIRLNESIEKEMSWGQPSNGLRSAVAIQTVRTEQGGYRPALFLAVQNISDGPIIFADSKQRATVRGLTIRRNNETQLRISIDGSTERKVLLMPGQADLIQLIPSNDDASQESLPGALLLSQPEVNLTARLVIKSPLRNTWTGDLTTGPADAAAAGSLLLPNDTTARRLLRKWLANSRLNGMIPGGTIGDLRKATANFINYNPNDDRTEQLKTVLDRIDMNRDWSRFEAVRLLNDVTDVYEKLPSWALELDRFEIAETIRAGELVPDNLKDAPWGEPNSNGLRAAWLLSPRADQYRMNTPLKSRLLFHNGGQQTIFLRVLTWNQSAAHHARSASGEEIPLRATHWTTIGQIVPCRLGPGEYTEVAGAGIGVGANRDPEDWRNTRVGVWIDTQAGHEVTFIPDRVFATGRDGRLTDVADSMWWPRYIETRLTRESPIPGNRDERTHIIKRVVRDLFGNDATQNEIDTFLSDATADALHNLAKRLSQRPGTVAFSGDLNSGTTQFQVLPVDPEAALQPRLAVGPGRYQVRDDAQLVVVGRGETHTVQLVISPPEGASVTFPIDVNEGRDSWSIAWKRDRNEFWVGEPGRLRHVVFSNPAAITMTEVNGAAINEIPKRFREALAPIVSQKQVDSPPAASGN